MADEIDLSLGGQGFEEASILAERALELARQYRVPPVPKAFEVWFAYAGGLNTTIRTRIDRARDTTGEVPATLIHKLHEEFLSPQAIGEGVARIGDRMGSDLAETIGLIEGGMAASETYARSIRRIDEGIPRGAGEAELRRRVAELHQLNRAHAAEIGRFSDRIMALRMQFTSMQQELRELRQSVLIDHMTQLPNRRGFDEALEAAIRRARQGRSGLAVALVDIDHFRAFNARWGKATGDQVIARVAALLRRNLREGDLAARFGGDEFAVLLPGLSLEAARTVADTLRDQIARLQLVRSDSRERMANMTACFSVTTLRREDTAHSLVARLDDFLLRAKEAGHNQIWSAS